MSLRVFRFVPLCFLFIIFIMFSNQAAGQFGVSSSAKASGGRKSGFLHRAVIGAGYASASEKIDSDNLDVYGGGFSAAFATGKFFLKNLAFHVEMFGGLIIDPTVEVNQASSTMSGSLACMGVGIGATYYFMPINIYLAGTFGAGLAQVKGGGVSGGTDFGFSGNALLGKEWWLNEDWGLGFAGQFYLMSLPDDSTLMVLGAGLVASVSFNASGRPIQPKYQTVSTSLSTERPSASKKVSKKQKEQSVEPKRTKQGTSFDVPKPAESEPAIASDEDKVPKPIPDSEMRTIKGRGWAIDVPEKWVDLETDNAILVKVRAPKLQASSFTTVTLNVELFMGNAKAYGEKLLSENQSSILHQRPVMVAGFEGIELDLDAGGNPPKRILQRATSDGAAGYRLSCIADKSVMDENLPICNQILDSFRFEQASQIK